MANRSRIQSEKSNTSSVTCMTGRTEMEYFWSIELNSDKRSVSLPTNSAELEDDDDDDFIQHTTFVKMAVLGANATADEQNIVVFQSTGQDGEIQKGAIANLTRGKNPMTPLELTLPGKIGGTFTLVEGSGPVSISGNHMLEFPKDDDLLDDTQAVSDNDEELNKQDAEKDDDDDDNDDDDDDDDEDEEESKDKKAGKRKAVPRGTKQKQKAKMDVDEEIDDDDEDEDVDYDSSEEDVKVKKAQKAKATGKKAEKGKTKSDKDSTKKNPKKQKK